MKKLLILSLFCLGMMPVIAANKVPIKIVSISDGDSIKAKIDENEFRVRLIGIDCYETCKIHRAYRQAYEHNLQVDDVVQKGNVSKQYLQNLYTRNKNKNIYLEFKGVDVYGRALGILYFDKMNVNEEMKKNGGCMFYEYK